MHEAIRVTALYAIFATLWILFSDRIVEFFSVSIVQMGLFSSLKGLAFVVATSVLLFSLVRREINEKNAIIAELGKEAKIRNQLIRELHHRIKNNLQTVLGLLNLGSSGSTTVEELKNAITSKLISMSAIFNIVYNFHDMKHITLERVLNEYQHLRHNRLARLEIDPGISYNVETTTSCLLIIDAISEGVSPNRSATELALIVKERGRLTFHIEGHTVEHDFAFIESDDFIQDMLDSIEGNLKINQGGIEITFSEIPQSEVRPTTA